MSVSMTLLAVMLFITILIHFTDGIYIERRKNILGSYVSSAHLFNIESHVYVLIYIPRKNKIRMATKI